MYKETNQNLQSNIFLFVTYDSKVGLKTRNLSGQ